MKEENVIYNYVLRYRRFTDDFGDDYVGESDYKNISEDLREAFKRINRKYIGLLPIGGTPAPPPLVRIGNWSI